MSLLSFYYAPEVRALAIGDSIDLVENSKTIATIERATSGYLIFARGSFKEYLANEVGVQDKALYRALLYKD